MRHDQQVAFVTRGRNFETLGEDRPRGELVAHETRGVQSQGLIVTLSTWR